MARLVLKALLLAALFAATVVSVALLPYPNPELFTLASLDKLRRLNETRPPRVILVGGSNLAFGVDSSLLSRRTGLTVVNMGLHFDLGLRQMLAEVEPALGAGDTVVLVPEYLLFFGAGVEGADTMVQAKLMRLASLWASSGGQWRIFAGQLLPQTARKALRFLFRAHGDPAYERVYRRSGFDRNGDLTTHLAGAEIGAMLVKLPHVIPAEPLNPAALELLNDFARLAAARGARCVLLYPPIPCSVYRQDQAGIEALHRRLTRELKLNVPQPPGLAAYPEDRFFDTVYHLAANGRQANTLRILQGVTK